LAPDPAAPIPTPRSCWRPWPTGPTPPPLRLPQRLGWAAPRPASSWPCWPIQGRVLRRPGGYEGGRRTPDRWTLITTGTGNNSRAASTALRAPPAAGRAWSRPAGGRLGAGELRDLVEACLAQRLDQALSATAIAKTLDRSAGAVANALQVLAGQGRVVQAQTNPHRYRIADASDPAAATD